MTGTIGTENGVHFDNKFSVTSLDPATFDYPLLEVVTVERHRGKPEHTLQPVDASPARGRFWLNKTAGTADELERLKRLAKEFNSAPRDSWLTLLSVTIPSVRASYEVFLAESGEDFDREALAEAVVLEAAFLS